VKGVATKDDQRKIARLIAEEMLKGEVVLGDAAKEKYGESIDFLTKKYVMGMVKNWWNKSLTLNGGVQHEVKEKGKKDEVVRELRALKAKMEAEGNQEGITRVEQAIKQRLEEITPKKEAREVNPELIPDFLRDLVASV
jgi:hypothetical protein